MSLLLEESWMGKNATFSSEMMSQEKEEKKVLFVSVCVISKMMVNAK
jgi:hypothetical protein